ncbi:CAP domain-containing protein [Metabacillus sediminilitoris]|uniref:LysM peptidoglycan-binding domain-containing protein n=1 Tax=Metabacillus sediminilitoris TaxID=2567941 RepID=A0A4S4BL65_9BACI|nr:CAP domain-containing protein [Metabacillus sediminilitoris]QGQ46532.1 LysM peptidoglycan-binding domain-containing protein [Metabacillus sediminilitoris]THF75299.1 LysM peptidoglycan-binding domain-containing protein [Metabacillus sediminilitoris]
MLKKLVLATFVLLLSGPAVSHGQIKMFNEPPFEYYKVSPGDTFWYIAKRYGLDYKKLMQLNPNVEPRNMQVGEVIRLKASASSPSGFEEQVVQLVNQQRAKAGLRPLTHRADVKNVAQKKAEDMINSNYFSHTSPNYGSPFDMLKTFGISYSYAGENIAKGQKTPQEVMNAWMNSSGHRANILKPEYDVIGVGFYHGAWVQMFIKAR